jgi:hypothetical protein
MKKTITMFKQVALASCFSLLLFTASCTSDDSDITADKTSSSVSKTTYTAPYTVFSSTLSNFKLQTDYESSDITDLSSYAESWFYLDSGNLMRLNNDGGSGTRTELRGLTEYNKTATKTMTVVAYLSSQPDGEVTVAQLHNSNSDVPALRISISGTTIYYKFNNVAVKGTTDTNNGAFSGITYTTGAKLTIVLKLSGSKIAATITSGTTTATTKTFSLADFDYSSGYYFKTGVYCQSSGTAEIKIKSITFS